MPGIVLADSSASPPRWQTPICIAGNAAVYLANVGAIHTARSRWERPLPASSRPRVLFTWHRFNFAAALALRDLPEERRPALLMHDGLASRALTHDSSVWLGYEVFVFRRRSSVPVREQITEYLRRSKRDLLMLPDAGGPYGRMKPGILEVAKAVDAPLVPLAVRASRALELGKKLQHVVPLPFCRFVLSAGEAIAGADATPERCQSALDRLFAELSASPD